MTAHTLYPIIQFGHANQPNSTSCLSSKAKAIIIHFCKKNYTVGKNGLACLPFSVQLWTNVLFEQCHDATNFHHYLVVSKIGLQKGTAMQSWDFSSFKISANGQQESKGFMDHLQPFKWCWFKSMYSVNNYWITETGRSDLFQCSLGILERISQGNRKMNLWLSH